MDAVVIVKRLRDIGDELTSLERKRDAIDARMKTLIREAHQLTKPSVDQDGESPRRQQKRHETNLGRGTPRFVQSGAPTFRSQVMGKLGEMGRADKHQIAKALGVDYMRVNYTLFDIRRVDLARHERGVWELTERGQQELDRLRSAGNVVTVDAEVIEIEPGEKVSAV